MFRIGIPVGIRVPLLAATVLLNPCHILAQRHGGGGASAGTGLGGGTGGRPTICLHDCDNNREGMSSEDSLKEFRRVIAIQATAEQRAAFAKISQYTQSASDRLKNLTEFLRKPVASTASATPTPTLAERGAALNAAIAQARAGNQNFLGSMSDTQKSGLKELTAKLSREEGELDKQLKAFNQIMPVANPEAAGLASSADTLNKELSGFQTEQLALGTEMGILLDGSTQGLAYHLPAVTNSINVAGDTISIPTSGVISRTAIENGSTLFSLQLVSDLSDLQHNVSELLQSSLTRQPHCGERIEVQQARMTPLVPASLVIVNLHYERWVCQAAANRSLTLPTLGGETEVASGDAEIEITITPSIESAVLAQNPGVHLVPEIRRVQADGLLRSLLLSGDLGVTLRDQIAASLSSTLEKAANFRSNLPAVAQQSASFQKVQFQDAGADQLTIVLDGQLRFSDSQTQHFAAQLQQRLSAQSAPAAAQ